MERGPARTARRKLTASPPVVSHSRATARPSHCTAHACCTHAGFGVRMALAVIPGLGWPKQNLCIPGDGGGSPYGGRLKPPGIGFGGPGGARSPSAAEPGPHSPTGRPWSNNIGCCPPAGPHSPGCGPTSCAAVRHGPDSEASSGWAANGDAPTLTAVDASAVAGTRCARCRRRARRSCRFACERDEPRALWASGLAQRALQLRAAPRMVEEEDGRTIKGRIQGPDRRAIWRLSNCFC